MKKIFIALIGMAMAVPSVFAVAYYVRPSGSDTNDGMSWSQAKQTIQAGVDVASTGDVVWVTNGVYVTGGRIKSGCNLLSRVLATNGVIIRSVNGPDQTIIDGGGAPYGSTNSVRPVLVANGSRLEGFTVIGGSTRADGVNPYDVKGGGVFVSHQSVVSNCIIRQCAANSGGGVYIWEGAGLVTHCQIVSNSANECGGAMVQSDTAGGYVRNCVIQRNTSSDDGGGAMLYHIGEVRNCLITDNACTNRGGGIYIDLGGMGAYVENCTITRNYAKTGGGLGYIISGATVKNTIIWGNTGTNWAGGSYGYSCLTPAASGVGNITNDPLFVDSTAGNFRLAAGSPCINAGTNLAWTTNAADLDGHSRTVGGRVDIGAYEYAGTPTPPSAPTGVSASDGTYSNKVLLTWNAVSTATGYQIFRNTINSSNGLSVFASTTATNYVDIRAVAWSNYFYWVKATNSVGTSGFSPYDNGFRSTATLHVSPYGDDGNDGTSWAQAKQTIQAGVDAVFAGDVVWVTNGVYSTGGRIKSGCNLLSRVLATNGAIIRSVNGPDQTIIDGGGAPCGSSNSVRPVLVANGSSVEGFTLIGGSTKSDGVNPHDVKGGGVFVSHQSVVSNCIIRQCVANSGGGVYIWEGAGLVTHCQIISNSANECGGAMVQSDTAGGRIQNCVIQYNTSSDDGGGAMLYHIGEVRNCLITDNSCTNRGGGIYIDLGGMGAYVENCTITRNYAKTGGGLGYIISGATVKNTIIWGNTETNWAGGSYGYSCLTPAASGVGNITNDPLFVDSAAGNFRLAAGSPCINAGTNLAWMTGAVDLDGNPRIMDGRVDIGAYEYAVTNPVIALAPASFTNLINQGQNCSSNTCHIWNSGIGTLAYSNGSDVGWITISPVNGTSTGEHDVITIAYNTMSLGAGSYTGVIAVTAPNAENSPQLITVNLTVVPRAPTGVLASDGTFTNKIRLNWNVVPGAMTYEVFRSITNNTETAVLLGNTVSTGYDDLAVSVDATYYYWVKAKTTTQTSAFSESDSGWSAVSIGLPTPTGISASDGEFADKVRVTWLQVSAATHYQVWRNTANNVSGGAQLAEIAGSDITSYEDMSANIDVMYYYWIRAKTVTAHGQEFFSEFSNSEMGYRAPSTSTLEPPSGFAASDGAYTDKVRLSWNKVTGAGMYEVWRNTINFIGYATMLGTTTNLIHEDTNVTANITYYYWVRARNPIATSTFSMPDIGFAAPTTGIGKADLAALNMVFLPGVLGVGDHPGAVSVMLVNYGPDSVIAPNARVGIDFYLSSNTNSGDSDDIWFGNYSVDVTLGASSYLALPLSTEARQNLTIPAVTAGVYNVFAKVRHEVPSMLTDPDMSNNSVMRAGVIAVTSSGPGPGYHLVNDYDGDGKSDVALYKEVTGEWLIMLSKFGYSPMRFVLGGKDYKPVIADYDGDGKADPAVCNRMTGEWKAMFSSSGYSTIIFNFGEQADMPVPIDYDGDGKADPAIYRSGDWVMLMSGLGYAALTMTLGGDNDVPVPADYDGDGISDLAVFRLSTGDWMLKLSTLDYWTMVFRFGGSGANPVPADYDGDGKADPAVYKESSGDWAVMMSRFNYLTAGAPFGGTSWVPVAADYDGDGKEDVAIYNDDQHMLKVLVSGNDYGLISLDVGGPGYEPAGWPR